MNLLQNLLGSKGDDILSSLHLSKEDLVSCNVVKERFNQKFNLGRNTIYERADESLIDEYSFPTKQWKNSLLCDDKKLLYCVVYGKRFHET